MAFDQVLTGWRWLALGYAIAGLVDDVIVPKPAMRTLACAKGLWCPAEQRYVHAITSVVLLAC